MKGGDPHISSEAYVNAPRPEHGIKLLKYFLEVMLWLTPFQQDIIREVVCLQADFEYENADEIGSILSGYSINGVSAQFGSSWNVYTDKGVAIRSDVYTLLSQTGLCCRLMR